MVNIDALLSEWAYRCKKGYPDLDSPSDLKVLKSILKEQQLELPSLKEEEYDPEIDRTTYIPLDKGIFKAFLKPTALIEDRIFQIKETEDKNKIIFTLDFNMNNADQKIKLYFDKISKNLIGWKLYESLNDFIEVKIINHKKFTIDNKKLLNEIFKLTESKSNIGMQYYGPYNGRKVKKFLGSGKLNQ